VRESILGRLRYRVSRPVRYPRLPSASEDRTDTRTPVVKVAEAVLLMDEVRRRDRRP